MYISISDNRKLQTISNLTFSDDYTNTSAEIKTENNYIIIYQLTLSNINLLHSKAEPVNKNTFQLLLYVNKVFFTLFQYNKKP